MKRLEWIILGALTISACSNKGGKSSETLDAETQSAAVKTEGIDSARFDRFVRQYVPVSIDFAKSINDSLAQFDLRILFDKATDEQREHWTQILLLKQYLYHLEKANQGYNLYDMRKGDAGWIIDEFIRQSQLSDNGEFLNSGHVVDVVNIEQSN